MLRDSVSCAASSLRRLRERELLRAGVHTYALSALTLAANLLSGITIARALGPDGRGQAVAVAAFAQTIGFAFSVGCAHAVSYRCARDPSSGGRLLTAWVLFLLPAGVIGVAVGELVVPVLFHAQSATVTGLARVYLLTVFVVLWGELMNGILLGSGHYAFVNVARFAQPAIFAVTLAVLWWAGALTVAAALAVAAGSSLLVQVVALRKALRITGGFGALDRRLARETLWYGFRGQGVVLAGALNQRLDVFIMPAFVAASSIGIYSIAGNVSLIVSTLAASFAALVLPAAIEGGRHRPKTIVHALHGVLAAAVVCAAVLFVFARPALRLVYGDAFVQAATTLRILLPGTVLLAASAVLIAGLYAANRPSVATGVQVSGLVVTVVGLLVFLPGHGIVAAALVSTAAYATVFTAALVAYRHCAALGWLEFLRP